MLFGKSLNPPFRGDGQKHPITINPSPVYLEGNLIGQVDFDVIEDGLGSRFTSKMIVNGVVG